MIFVRCDKAWSVTSQKLQVNFYERDEKYPVIVTEKCVKNAVALEDKVFVSIQKLFLSSSKVGKRSNVDVAKIDNRWNQSKHSKS